MAPRMPPSSAFLRLNTKPAPAEVAAPDTPELNVVVKDVTRGSIVTSQKPDASPVSAAPIPAPTKSAIPCQS